MTTDPENTQEDTPPGNAAPQSGSTMGMDGELREDSPKGIGGDDSGGDPRGISAGIPGGIYPIVIRPG